METYLSLLGQADMSAWKLETTISTQLRICNVLTVYCNSCIIYCVQHPNYAVTVNKCKKQNVQL